MNEIIAKAINLKKSFNQVVALDNVSFEIKNGEVFGLVGPDGAGKTTTMRILAAILSPDEGTAEILGMNTVKNSIKIHDRIAYMSQKFGLYQDLTVEENIKFYADIYGVKKSELKESMQKLLEWSSLAAFRKRPAGKLSGGMKQKLGLACALIHTPQLLLLDEPTNGVDPVSRREFWNLLYKLVADGLTIIMTTAYLDEAERCHRLAFIDNGRITAKGTPTDIINLIPQGVLQFDSTNPFNDCNILTAKTNAISTVFGSQVHVIGNAINEKQIRVALNRELDIRKSKGSIEDAFVYLSKTNHE